jgi:hypothetical protein
MQQLLAKGPAGQQLPVVFTRDGVGTLYYMMRLRYAANVARLSALDQGFRVERSYSLQNSDESATSFKAGDLIEVTLRIRNTKERRYVAVTDPIPAGTEPVEAWFATTASELAQAQYNSMSSSGWSWWERGGWDHTERHDDRVNVFAIRLGAGDQVFTYLVRATTAGTFLAALTHVEEMYEPEVFGCTATTIVEVKSDEFRVDRSRVVAWISLADSSPRRLDDCSLSSERRSSLSRHGCALPPSTQPSSTAPNTNPSPSPTATARSSTSPSPGPARAPSGSLRTTFRRTSSPRRSRQKTEDSSGTSASIQSRSRAR